MSRPHGLPETTAKKLVELHRQGLSTRTIGERLKLSPDSVRYYRRRLGLRPPLSQTVPGDRWHMSGGLPAHAIVGLGARVHDFLTTLRPTLKAAADEAPTDWQRVHRDSQLAELEHLLDLITRG